MTGIFLLFTSDPRAFFCICMGIVAHIYANDCGRHLWSCLQLQRDCHLIAIAVVAALGILQTMCACERYSASNPELIISDIGSCGV